ncbi:cap-specific mRNA (nucleoside-2'-O-)-methyltransferase 1 isoform X1 [Leptidea sinapis]|uniref:cap-specific mRNA (nucleoside-2'-O-)-methyltransferase 1 isoform X1 n=1 Tax=Leptidea sinapis TaxID=189913 RepID=UPI00212E25AD|nr:cap-specific mRNA (nucleoside-2'-O-)-methyltransferase 1 isoform X1 [Leptidea sinapis]
MNLSDASDDGSSSEDGSVPAKRYRSDTYGASSTTSHGSALQESDEETKEKGYNDHMVDNTEEGKKKTMYIENTLERSSRLSRSSLSENCSSPNDGYDDYRPGFDENNDGMIRPSFQSSTESTFYNKSTEMEQVFQSDYSDKSKRMMSNMGYKPGKGLGKFEHGRVDPVEASNQKGRRGLGLQPSVVGEVPKEFTWSPDETKAVAKEAVVWMPSPPEQETLSGDVLDDWLKKGPKKLTIDDEKNFVEPSILEGIIKAKTIFDSLYDEDMRNARFRSNPYETIGSVIFLNRAAVKMANLDAVFDFMFTQPTQPSGESSIDKNDILYFADVCAGPGGFSEYVLYKKGWGAKGFGFTLKGPNDFKISDFYAGSPETFNTFYGVKNDGNVYDPANLMSLKDFVLNQTDDKGVHFLMADGGFSVRGQENLQEILSKQLYLCQCLAALMLVRTGGHFVVKMFDVFTKFSVGLIYIMYRCFDQVCIIKPVTSRPANSERYLVCKWKKTGTESAEHHLYSVNSSLWNDRDTDITELVPLSVIKEDKGFYNYIYNSNCVIGESQIKHLLKIAEFSKNKDLKEPIQTEMREECLKLWQLPDRVRTQPERRSSDETLIHILSLMKKQHADSSNPFAFKNSVLNKPPEYVERVAQLHVFKNVYDWHFTFLTSGKNRPDLRIFIGCGGKRVYQLDGTRWKNVVGLSILLPANTLIYGEIVKEFRGQGTKQMHSKALHVIDAMMIGGVDISHLPLSKRINQCAKLCTALEKPLDDVLLPIRCKRFFNMESFSSAVGNLEYRAMKRSGKAVTIDIPKRNQRDDLFYVVGSVMFIKEIKEPWSAQMSKSHGRKYYFKIEKEGPRSEYHVEEEAAMDMIAGFTSRVMWPWEEEAIAILDGYEQAGISKVDMENYIARNIQR